MDKTIEKELDELSNEEALDHIARLVDSAFDEKSSEQTSHVFNLIKALKKRALLPNQISLLHYLHSNAWANRIQEQGDQHSWNWEQTALENQLLELRRALNHEGFCQHDSLRQCQIYTNLGNQLSSIGRFIEAIASWDNALEIEPNFAMAHANLAQGLEAYCRSVYDPGHREILALNAYDAYERALHSEAIFDSEENRRLKPDFTDRQEAINKRIDVAAIRQFLLKDQEQYLEGTKKEKHYKSWTLKNRLYVNPLNDASNLPIASHDVMTLPSIVVPIASASHQPPPIVGLYNQLKQEYASARFLFYEALHSYEPHYSDADVLLYNTLDYPSYGLSVEKLRSAFRMAYSLFDKIAYCLNRYLALRHDDQRVNFRNLWYEPNKKTIHSALEKRENWPLRGLYWLSKDFYDPEFKLSTEPEASELATLRNHLEHKYLQIHDALASKMPQHPAQKDDWAYHISRPEFEAKTLTLFRQARSALIYLAVAVHREEIMRASERGDAVIAPIALGQWEDDWKR